MKRFQIVMCMLAVTLMFCSSAMAQRGGGMRGMMQMMSGGGGFQLDSNLLAIEEVQKELGLSEEEMKEIGEKAKELRQAFRSEMMEIRRDGGDAAEMEALYKELKEEEGEFVGKLSDKQKERLSQLKYQQMGIAMYQDKDAQEGLGFSDDQKGSIKETFESFQTELRNAMEEAREARDFAAMQETMTEMGEKLEKDLGEILTDEQKEKAEEMKGEKFEFPQPQRRRRGGNRSDF